MLFDPADLLALGMRYCWVAFLVLVPIVAHVLLWRCSQANRHRRAFQPLSLLITLAVLASILLYLSSTLKKAWLLTALGSEDDSVAEAAYSRLNELNGSKQAWLLGRVKSCKETDNTRFYLCNFLANKVVEQGFTNSHLLVDLSNAPPINPRFFSSNSYNKDFFASRANKNYPHVPTNPAALFIYFMRLNGQRGSDAQ